jgi:hypothetical protein
MNVFCDVITILLQDFLLRGRLTSFFKLIYITINFIFDTTKTLLKLLWPRGTTLRKI